MGNWRTVRIVGTCAASEVEKLRSFVKWDGNTFDNFHCLSNTGGLAGLGRWPAENIEAVGNLAERGYDQDSVAEALALCAAVAPSLAVKVHVGDENEEQKCIATVTLTGGKATVGDPEVETVGEISKEQMGRNLTAALTGRRD